MMLGCGRPRRELVAVCVVNEVSRLLLWRGDLGGEEAIRQWMGAL